MTDEALIRAESLGKRYGSHRALRDVSFGLSPGARMALVGAAGSGKTTLALCLAGFEEPSSGSIRYRDQVARGPRRALQLLRQDSPLAFNPTWTTESLLEEPLRFQPGLAPEARRVAVRRLIALVGLDESYLARRSGELSGGQRQRIALARALAVEEMELLVLDEPLRGLDPSAADALADLILRTQRNRGFALLYISHDLDRVREIGESVAVMAHGAIVETAPVERFFAAPAHAAGRALIEAAL